MANKLLLGTSYPGTNIVYAYGITLNADELPKAVRALLMQKRTFKITLHDEDRFLLAVHETLGGFDPIEALRNAGITISD